MEKGALGFNKLHQMGWLLNAIWNRYKALWNLSKHVTIDKIMICYKGTYYPIKQYMRNKVEKMGPQGLVLSVLNFKIRLEF